LLAHRVGQAIQLCGDLAERVVVAGIGTAE
jgi:hypothetical protein